MQISSSGVRLVYIKVQLSSAESALWRRSVIVTHITVQMYKALIQKKKKIAMINTQHCKTHLSKSITRNTSKV